MHDHDWNNYKLAIDDELEVVNRYNRSYRLGT